MQDVTLTFSAGAVKTLHVFFDPSLSVPETCLQTGRFPVRRGVLVSSDITEWGEQETAGLRNAHVCHPILRHG